MIGLMDCNNFFVSCERLFRPDLLGKPVAVLSSNDGCIVARSQEVKNLGIPMGIPYFEVKDLCKKQNVTLFSTNLALYRDISARVMSVLKEEFDICEVYSVDEAFFEIGENITEEKIEEIRARIIQKTGIPVSIGIATTKTLAKVANAIAKKRTVRCSASNSTGVCVLNNALWEETKIGLSCGSIWGIGRQTSASLSRHKIYTVDDLCRQDMTFIKQLLGVVGERILMELKGISVYKIGDSSAEEQKSYSSTRSFAQPTHEKVVLMSALGHHVAHLGEKLRRDGTVAGKITILIRGSRFGSFALREYSLGAELHTPTSDTLTLIKEASRLLDRLYDPEVPYKKAGVIMSAIVKKEYVSHSLFEDRKAEKDTNDINAFVDVLNKKYGSGTLHSGVVFGVEKWQEQKKIKSREYTTRWSEIATIKAK